jgi:hypothetical protein
MRFTTNTKRCWNKRQTNKKSLKKKNKARYLQKEPLNSNSMILFISLINFLKKETPKERPLKKRKKKESIRYSFWRGK